MKIKDIITEGAETYQPPALAVGDKILKGKFKNIYILIYFQKLCFTLE